MIETNHQHTVNPQADALRSVLRWAKTKCPCTEEKPDPCTLCGATVVSGRCMAVENTIPAHLIKEIEEALIRS